MKRKVKIGRNDFCPCGSGLKYKKCHLLKSSELPPQNAPFQAMKKLRKNKNSQFKEDIIRRKELGEIRPIITTETPYGKLVAVGNKIFKTDKSANFHGFILTHMLHLFDEQWIKDELATSGTANPICKWYSETFFRYPSNAVPKRTKLNLSYNPLISTCYDLFVLSDHMELQNDIVQRLKHHDQFASARYELYVASTCIRAGYRLDFEDEKERSSRHVEFLAEHKYSGQKLLIEAKRSNSTRHNYGRLINDALNKDQRFPLLIFVDINKSPSVADNYLIKENKSLKMMFNSRIQKSPSGNDLYNLIIFTNHPYDCATEKEPKVDYKSLVIESRKPLNTISDKKTVERMKKAISQYGKIPKEFPK